MECPFSWKKQELRRRGAHVVEHVGDYSVAVAEGRQRSLQDPKSYFVDDESSILLLEGYAAAALPLAEQLAAAGRTPSKEQPLFVYLPCGVGGAPGGISLGLTALFGSNVHCFFAEPVGSPCMLLKMAVGAGNDVSVYDYGLDNRTDADGLAVPQASDLVASRIRDVLSGIFTVRDEQLFSDLLRVWESEGFEIEPSGSGAGGPDRLISELASALKSKPQLTSTELSTFGCAPSQTNTKTFGSMEACVCPFRPYKRGGAIERRRPYPTPRRADLRTAGGSCRPPAQTWSWHRTGGSAR